jgi:hypothetical protein
LFIEQHGFVDLDVGHSGTTEPYARIAQNFANAFMVNAESLRNLTSRRARSIALDSHRTIIRRQQPYATSSAPRCLFGSRLRAVDRRPKALEPLALVPKRFP